MKNCKCCNTKLKYNEKYDEYYCEKCNQWKNEPCKDSVCEFCNNRPKYPIQKD